MNFKEDCGFPYGALTITNEEHGKIFLKRCVRHKPFKVLTYDEFLEIPDIIKYVEDFNYENVSEYIKTDIEFLGCLPCEALNRPPRHVTVSLSHLCNIDCRNCFFEGRHIEKPGDKTIYFETLNKIKGHKLDTIEFTDQGEPFVYYNDIINYLKTLSLEDTIHVRFFTNGMLLSHERLDELKKLSLETGVNYRFAFSIDGITKETFEAVRRGANFEKVLDNFGYALSLFGKNDVYVSYTVKKPALQDAPYAKSFFKKNFGITPNMYYDLFDEDCKKFIYEAQDLDIDEREEIEKSKENKVDSLITDSCKTEIDSNQVQDKSIDNKNYVHKDCIMDKRLEIMWDEYTNRIMLSRCCYTKPFAYLPLDEFYKVKDIIKYSCVERNHKLKDSAQGWCATTCNIKPEIKVVTVGLSRACNLHCYHCFFTQHEDSPELKNLYFETLEKIKGHNLEIIHMQSSGEVFFYYYKIKEYLKSLTTNDTKEVNFQSNGLLLSNERLKELKQISEQTGIKYTFNYSIDAISSETYKKIRVGGDFNKLLDIFEKTINIFGKENMMASFTIKKGNEHEAASFRKFFKDNFDFEGTYITYDLMDKECHDFFDKLNQGDIC